VTGDGPTPAFAVGGPLDGSVLGEGNAEEYEVLMADGSRHRYLRTTADTGTIVYRWAGPPEA
jgi:hypothetical protein